MNYNFFWILWAIFATIQTTLLSIYWVNARRQQKEWDEIKKQNSQSFDVFGFCVYNSKAYWREKENIYRASYRDKNIDMQTKERVDPFKAMDISPAELMNILDLVEKSSS